MSINLSPYDTTALAAWSLKPILEHVTQASVSAGGAAKVASGHHSTPFPLVMIQGGTSFSDAVPLFRHPIPFANPLGSEGEHPKILALDVREYGAWYPPTQSFRVRNGIEYGWQMRRAVVTQLWMGGRPETLRDLSPLPATTYSALIAECVARKFALNAHERMTVAVLAAYFYYGLFTNASDFSEMEKPLIMGKIAQFTHVPADQVFALIEHRPVIHGLDGFITAVQETVQNIALENLNLGTFLTSMVGVWSGSNAREIMGVALEHVPTWLCIVAASFDSSVYKRSAVAKMAQNFDRGGASASFVRSLEVLMGGPKAVTFADGSLDATYDAFFHA